jgi:hypothetical protein
MAVHSNVARPSGPAKLHVISKIPGAPSTSFTRSDAGHDADGFAAYRSQAATRTGRIFLKRFFSALDKRP